MSNKQKTLVDVENTFIRRTVFLLVLLLTPFLILYQAAVIAIMEGFPSMIAAFAMIGRSGEKELFKEVWLGRKEYHRRLREDIGK